MWLLTGKTLYFFSLSSCRVAVQMEEILAGESKNVEFKERLPGRSIQYMKSVVAFANGSGGKIIFGIADKTREVVGFEEEDAFRTMDAIANAVSDSCEPAIIPDITLQTVEDKTIIVVEVPEGRQRPYYINRWDGMPVSTFVLPERPARPMNI